MQIPIARPYIGAEEKRAVIEVLESGQLSQGPKVAEFEQAFAANQGARFGVATCNGTAALTCALMAHGIAPGDEVIVPSFSFFATASSVLGVYATPVFADIDPETYCLSPESAEAAITVRTRAIMPVHLYGHPADMPRFETLCQRRGLLLLADAAQAHGAAIAGRGVGSWGTACFSFFPSKNMTTTAGGMVLTNDESVYRRLRLVRHQGMETRYEHEALGLNFRMTDIEAAIGLVQLGPTPTTAPSAPSPTTRASTIATSPASRPQRARTARCTRIISTPCGSRRTWTETPSCRSSTSAASGRVSTTPDPSINNLSSRTSRRDAACVCRKRSALLEKC